jgi:hypothetical protein
VHGTRFVPFDLARFRQSEVWLGAKAKSAAVTCDVPGGAFMIDSSRSCNSIFVNAEELADVARIMSVAIRNP